MVSASCELQIPAGLVGSEVSEVLIGKKATTNKWDLQLGHNPENLLQHTLNFKCMRHYKIFRSGYLYLPCLGTASMERNRHVIRDRKEGKQLISRAWRAQDKPLFNDNKKPTNKQTRKTRVMRFWQCVMTFTDFLLQRSQKLILVGFSNRHIKPRNTIIQKGQVHSDGEPTVTPHSPDKS